MSQLEKYFEKFRHNVIGYNQNFHSPYGEKTILYADWTASGRMYKAIEDHFVDHILPFVGNTHTETTVTGNTMTLAYQNAKKIIREHVNANDSDILISSNSGMTGVVNKFQRILGLKIHERFKDKLSIKPHQRPIVFISHMEHHSNQTSWLETIADVVIINPDSKGLLDLDHLDRLLEKFKDRKVKIAAITSCSNVTGIKTPYYEVAKKMHENRGYIFVDFACSAPYINIDMHKDELSYLDAIYFSPHKFLGGPSSSGILIFNENLYQNKVPDNPGGGTVDWTNPWGEHKYHEEIEAREDGGTPAFLQTIRIALCVKLKEDMGVTNILSREEEQMAIIWDRLEKMDCVHVLAPNHKERLGVISFYIEDLHYNLAVKLLNDKYGIQVRGGCSCAGTYGHFLLNVDPNLSKTITCSINEGKLSDKPGWVRMSIHPVMSDKEITYIMDSLEELTLNKKEWAQEYEYCSKSNEFKSVKADCKDTEIVDSWFNFSFA